MINAHQKGLKYNLTNVGGTNLGIGEIAESLIGSERLFTNEPRSDWTKPPVSLSDLEILFDCSNNASLSFSEYLKLCLFNIA